MLSLIGFWLLAVIAVFFAVVMLFVRHPIHSALSLVATMCCLAGLYLILASEFIAVMQVIVYAGAIMVLIIYVIMLLQLASFEHLFTKLPKMKTFMILLGIAIIVQMCFWMGFTPGAKDVFSRSMLTNDVKGGEVSVIAEQIFTQYLLPFEITSVILLVAIIGAIVLASKPREENQ